MTLRLGVIHAMGDDTTLRSRGVFGPLPTRVYNLLAVGEGGRCLKVVTRWTDAIGAPTARPVSAQASNSIR